MKNLKDLGAQLMKWKFLAAAFSVLLMLCTQAAPAFALELRIRNDFEKKMFVSVTYFDAWPLKWRTLGWFTVDPRSESRVIINASKTDVYIYAELTGESTTWGNGDITRTVIAEPFSYYDREECPPGWNRRNVRYTKYEARNGMLDFRPGSSAARGPLRNAEKDQPRPRLQPPVRTPPDNAPSRAGPAAELLNLINAERRRAGLPNLRLDENLSRAADRRASEIIIRYSHDRPDGRNCRTVFAEFGLAPRISGENVAERSSWHNTSMEAFNRAFMNSPTHRANILHRSFTAIGIGFARHGDSLYVAELFAGGL